MINLLIFIFVAGFLVQFAPLIVLFLGVYIYLCYICFKDRWVIIYLLFFLLAWIDRGAWLGGCELGSWLIMCACACVADRLIGCAASCWSIKSIHKRPALHLKNATGFSAVQTYKAQIPQTHIFFNAPFFKKNFPKPKNKNPFFATHQKLSTNKRQKC